MKKILTVLFASVMAASVGMYAWAGDFAESEAGDEAADFSSDCQEEVDEEPMPEGPGNLWDAVEELIGNLFGNGQEQQKKIPKRPQNNPKDSKAEIIPSGDYTYSINSDKKSVTIVEYTGVEDVIEIPAELGGFPVSEIGYEAFNYKTMKSISIPDGIQFIGERAFEYCTITDKLQLPENVIIMNDAFSYANLPAAIEIPAGTAAGECAFSYCDTIEQLMVGPEAVIRGRAFEYCDCLKQLVCAEGSQIETGGFGYCHELEEVILCGDVDLGEDAFHNCENADINMTEADEYEIRKASGSDNSPTGGLEGGTTGGQTGGLDGGTTGGLTGGLAGGWKTTEDSMVPEEAKAVFDQAMPDHDKLAHEPVALLATQVVNGTNYCFLCRTTVKDSDEMPVYQIAYIWQDTEGNVHILDLQDISFGPGGEDTAPKTEAQTGSEHRVTVSGEDDVFISFPAFAKAGDTVRVHTYDVTDGEVKVEVNGSDIGTWEEWGTYSFIMPDEDVELYGWISTEGYPGA